MNILTVLGARPQLIKAAVVSRALAAQTDGSGVQITEAIVHTGQHFDHRMSRLFFDEMDIPEPVVNLGISGGHHGQMTGAMIAALEREIQQRAPDLVLVYGDTNSTLAGALAAAKLCVPVAHVEAGLRSYNRRMPEELNRVLTDRVSELLFCPSMLSRAQLEAEGITSGVHVVGDVMIDALVHYRSRAVAPQRPEPFALATIHRAGNTDDAARLGRIIDALGKAPVNVVLPLHPRTRGALKQHGINPAERISCVEPLSYFEMLGHLDACRFVLTDSGGLQKEAYHLGKKCITLREETEWRELVDVGANRVVGADPRAIQDAMVWGLEPLAATESIYGEGDAGAKIVRCLVSPPEQR